MYSRNPITFVQDFEERLLVRTFSKGLYLEHPWKKTYLFILFSNNNMFLDYGGINIDINSAMSCSVKHINIHVVDNIV